MNSRFIGGILLIVGTSIGGGMLALPVANAATGFWQSSLFLLFCWALMTLGALFILEANLYLPPGKHMVSMAEATLGVPGLLVAWLSYLFLLYSLLAGYISGGADVFSSLLSYINIHLREWQAIVLFTFIFGMIVYGGIKKVDLFNRLLMFGKLGAYCILVLLIAPHVKPAHLVSGDYRFITGTVMILITSFGYAIIIPNLRDYFNDDLKTLRKVILIGSCIPLFCYLAWDAIIMGTVPTEGNQGLAVLLHDDHTTSALADILSRTVNSQLITSIFNFFTSICMLTAFLGVSLCLISFLADGFKVEQKGRAGLMLFILTFLPPLLLVIYSPGIYIRALNYAGIFCVILLLLLPALMTVYGRKRYAGRYTVPGGAITQWLVIIFSVILMINAIWQLLSH
ncbi:tyrosine-specific transport protein [Legionella quinlivanii]|uniref:Tyrosine-specific transport protein n=1 Tax=Legionella quinlivanii TaxID=45073 RepID=A0A0W0Y752_9GAMM|nr:aromatic amino acid transport family protein [Legionella quinlivanii]KTD52498.1 tyrosine-specific transport protein [Legionella quinlivanii]MCW8451880.1 tryptophan/tyrosine permease [Legionella quinlivanii]SEG24134.1 tyrosine-specific transport protein [Legionella quinlivanii DSM 21216]STY09923.1 tyrosine-specific transport protein [Legionella quinlivanii]